MYWSVPTVLENIVFIYENNSPKVLLTENFSKAFLTKNCYIPAERNILAIPGVFGIKMSDNYVQEYIFDWLDIREKYNGSHELPLLDLGEKYFYNEKVMTDMIELPSGRSIRLSQASSGLQSVTPLCVYIDYLTSWIYLNEENRSAESRKIYLEMILARLKEIEDSDFRKYLAKMSEMPLRTNLVVEEAELNLFPKTQVRLIYYILSKVEHSRDTLVMTTHSPYILYALNNCMIAFLTEQIDKETVKCMTDIPEKAWTNPKEVSVWELQNGRIREERTIQDDRGLIRGNYFDRVMQNVMADFSNLTNLLD